MSEFGLFNISSNAKPSVNNNDIFSNPQNEDHATQSKQMKTTKEDTL